MLIRHYCHVEPDDLSDEEWCMMAKDVEWFFKKTNPEK